MTTAPTPEDLVTYFRDGSFAARMARFFELNDEAEIATCVARCAALHDEGSIDLLMLVESHAVQALEASGFFLATDFLCRVLTELEAPPLRMMACVDALVTRGGADLVANRPNGAFRTWCARDPRRAQEVIKSAQDGNDLAVKLVVFALEALKDLDIARHTALDHADDLRYAALTALSRMEHGDAASRAESFRLFGHLLDQSTDDKLGATMLAAIAAIVVPTVSSTTEEALALIRRLCREPGPYTLHQAAGALWAHGKTLPPEIVSVLLDAHLLIDPTNAGSIEKLDHALQTLLRTGHEKATLDFVTRLLSSRSDDLKLSAFQSFVHTLMSGPSERLSGVTVRWLCAGEFELCKGLSDALGGHERNEALQLLPEHLAIPAADQIVLCQRAIGYFFLQPVKAASVLVSVLRVCDELTAHALRRLLINPLLLNYGGIRDYLSALPAEDAAKPHVDTALEQNANYLAALHDVPRLKEMEPPEHHRRIERLRQAEWGREVHKQAQSRSVFFGLVKRSVVLYGKGTLTLMRDPNGVSRPMEMDLHTHSVSIETPRMEIIDPISLAHTLLLCKMGRLPL
ncbi:MAG TPA: hypothetical protein VEY95_09525 [Azospirillaceae bacterium]|nr:hypothetical protein [Azospirillaceae bacterium]